MIPDDDLWKLAQRLLTKTQKNEVAWSRADPSHGRGVLGVYDFQQGETYVAIIEATSHTRGGVRRVFEVRVSGVPSGSVSDEDSPNAVMRKELLKNLYDEAHRAAVRWDQALDQLNKLLETDQVLGRNPEVVTAER